MKRFCRSRLSATGLTARRESSITASSAANQQAAPASSDSAATTSSELLFCDTSKNTATLPSRSWRTR